MYKYYNPHPKGLSTDDCVKRAIVVVTGLDYSKVQRELNEYKMVTGAKSFNSVKNLRYVDDIRATQYMSTKALAVLELKYSIIFNWYQVYYPSEYQQIMADYST